MTRKSTALLLTAGCVCWAAASFGQVVTLPQPWVDQDKDHEPEWYFYDSNADGWWQHPEPWGLQPDPDWPSSNKPVGERWTRQCYDDLDGNGWHGPSEPHCEHPRVEWSNPMQTKDGSCWMASAANILRYVGGPDRYATWAYDSGVPGFPDTRTFDDGGEPDWALRGDGYRANDGIKKVGIWWNDVHPEAWTVARLKRDLPVCIGLDFGPSNSEHILHTLTVYSIDLTTQTMTVADSDRDPNGADFSTYSYYLTYDEVNTWIWKITDYSQTFPEIYYAASLTPCDWSGLGAGGYNSDWHNAANWSTTQVPHDKDIVDIGFDSGADAAISSSAAALRLRLYANAANLRFQTGACLSVGTTTCVGVSGVAYITHDAGQHVVSADLVLGRDCGSEGTYQLHNVGSTLQVGGSEYVGRSGTGNFVQTAGTNTVTGSLTLGVSPGSHGTYHLSGGQLSVGADEHIGYESESAGTFVQTGGSNMVGNSLSVGSPPGLDVWGVTATYELSGDSQLSARTEHVGTWCGEATFTQTGGTNTILGDLHIWAFGAGSKYDLSGDGLLSVENIFLEPFKGNATFTQAGGTNVVRSGLYVAADVPADAIYQLSGTGKLSANREYIAASYPEGIYSQFVQSGGTNTGTNSESCLYVGEGTGRGGTYQLTGGELSIPYQYVGASGGTGRFVQTGGSNTRNTFGLGICVGYSAGSYGTYELSGTGQIVSDWEFVGCFGGTGMFIQSGGTNTVLGSLEIPFSSGSGTYTISGGALEVGHLFLGRDASGTLNVTDPGANISISNLLQLGANSRFSAAQGSTIHMNGADFENLNTDPTTVAGLGSLVLIFEGGPDSVNDFEVAGEDLGATAAGWADNFALNMLVLGGSDVGRIRLVDNYDNRSGSEALYVHSLVLAPATTIDLNDLNLYFLKDAQAKQLFGGDANLDGCVDGLDYNLWSLHYRTTGGWTEGNFNADVFVDGLDYDVWSLNYLSGYGAEAAGVPEAGALVLLGVGAMAFIRQRRR